MTTVCENFMASVSPGGWGKVLKWGVEAPRGTFLEGESDLGDSRWDRCFSIKRIPSKRMESLQIPSQIPQHVEKEKERKNTSIMWARLTVQKSKSHSRQHVVSHYTRGLYFVSG